MTILDKKVERRKCRIRYNVKRLSYGRKRLSVFRSERHVYAQIIDDDRGVTLCSASTLDKEFPKSEKKTGNVNAASSVGKMIAKRALDLSIQKVVFDRGSYAYHGRVKALAEAARESGLVF